MGRYRLTVGLTHFYSVRVNAESAEDAKIKGCIYIKRHHKEMAPDNKKAQITQLNLKPTRTYPNEQDYDVVPVTHDKRK